MNSESLSKVLQYWTQEFVDKQKLPTQYPNSDIQDLDKRAVYCEITLANEVRTLDGSSCDANGNAVLHYTETGEMNFTLFDDRGEGEEKIRRFVDCIKEVFTDQVIGEVEFFQARSIPFTPVDEKWIIQVIAPFETQFSETKKENIP
jgi:hypothetical protein